MRRIRLAVTLAVVVAILAGPLALHAAADTDLAYGQPVTLGLTCSDGSVNGPYIGSGASLVDNDNSTFAQWGSNGYPAGTWAAVHLASAVAARDWQLVFRNDGSANPNSGAYTLWASNTAPGGCTSGPGFPTTAYTVIAAGVTTMDSPSTGDTGRHSYTNTTAYSYYGVTWGIQSSGARSIMATFSLYLGTVAAFTDYVYNLRAAHPSFARQYRWSWAKTFAGSYTFTDSAHHVIASRSATFVAGTDEPQPPQPPVSINCIPVCGHDTYTITVTDTGAGAVVSYDIDSDADGTLIPNVVPPFLTGATFCYQATTHQCAAIDSTSADTAVGTVWVSYNFTGDSATTYHVQLCERALELLAPACWSYSAGLGGTDWNFTPGTHTGSFHHNTAHGTSDVAEIHASDAFGHHSYLYSLVLDFSAGGSVTVTQQQPITPESTIVCDRLNVVCGIQALFSLAPGAILAGFDTLMSPLRAKQPFATIIGSAPTILAQLGRASAAVTSTSTCTGVDLVVPLGISGLPTPPPVNGHVMPTAPVAPSSIPAGPGRTAGPFTARVLDCATFESIVGGWSWFPTFRAFLDVAVYAAYGYSQLIRWQPKPQLTA